MKDHYQEFLKTKTSKSVESGFEVAESELNSNLFDFQRHIVKVALKKGRYAVFVDCGLGKTLIQLEWANKVTIHTNNPVLILAPLAVVGQTINEGKKFGIDLQELKSDVSGTGIYISNYEQLHNINCSSFSGIVLDESAVIKNYSGATRNAIITNFANTPYKLACTATPSPNDELEIGNHAEFLNVMTSQDMRAMYFTTDKEIINGEKYRLKRHAEKVFYKWISTWAIMINNPSDIGYKGDGYNLPGIKYIEKQIITSKNDNGELFNSASVSATDFNGELRRTKVERMSEVVKIVNASTEPFIVWVKHNEEGEYLQKLIPDAVEVKGSDNDDIKKKNLLGFAQGAFRVLITKSKIAQSGLNYQHCNNQVFASLDFSFESMYQSIRRSYRFGQKKQVNIYIITTDTMQNVIKSIEEKQSKFFNMQNEMKNAIMVNEKHEVTASNTRIDSTTNSVMYLGDCVEESRKLADNSMDYSFFSPPFGALYVFSNDPKDMSNVKNNDEFMQHFRFLVKELIRVIKPGRLCSIHMMQSTTLLGRDGFYSIVDFRGELIRLFQSEGFYFHAENMIRKDPKTAAIRTKNRQLMHGTTKKDSSIVRPGLADYILTFRKPGTNEAPITNNIPFDLWCKMAEPVWLEVNEGDTLPYRGAKGDNDERHITATQLTPIEWCYLIWSNVGDTIFTPFMGIGSEVYQAIKMNRKAVGIELKESYFKQSVKNAKAAENIINQAEMFGANG